MDVDGRLVKAVAHPLRVRILGVLDEREIASPVELASELGVDLQFVSYHVRRLHALGFLQLVSRTPRRGAIEHHYRAKPGALVSGNRTEDDEPRPMPGAVIAALAQDLVRAAVDGAQTGGFDRQGSTAAHALLRLDTVGQQQLGVAMETLAHRARAIEAASVARQEARPGTPTRVVLGLVLVEHDAAGARETARRRPRDGRPGA